MRQSRVAGQVGHCLGYKFGFRPEEGQHRLRQEQAHQADYNPDYPAHQQRGVHRHSDLSIYPMVKEGLIDPKSIIVDAKSGTSGAGRGAKVPNLFCEVNENIKAYGVTTHRHTPEIEEQLSYAAGEEVMINFTPHLVPMQRASYRRVHWSVRTGQRMDDARTVPESFSFPLSIHPA